MPEDAPQPELTSSPTPRRQRKAVRIIGICCALVFLGFLALCLFLDRFGQVERARPAQAIVVLGARILSNGQPGDSLTARTRHAVKLYKRGLAPAIICTGGLGDYPPIESVAAMKLAREMGVPAKALLAEKTSHDTRENVRNAAAICREHGWTRVIAVSDPYHLWRVRRDFALEGITAYPSPALDCERNRKPLLRIQWTIREALAVIRDIILAK